MGKSATHKQDQEYFDKEGERLSMLFEKPFKRKNINTKQKPCYKDSKKLQKT